ncbi:MAG: hypothetical protein ACM3XN_05270 [Chloroflexota bacterium]
MRIIRTQADIDGLRGGAPFGEPFLRMLEAQFNQLVTGLGNGASAADYDASGDNPLAVLEPGDNVSDLRTIGIHGGLTGLWPEYVDPLDVGGRRWYRVAQLFTNDYMVWLYVRVGDFGDEVDRWLAEQAGESEAPISTTEIGAVSFSGPEEDGDPQ